MPRRLSTGSLTARPQFASGSCRTASNSTLTSQRWSFLAPLISSGQLPTSPPSTLLEALCRWHRSSSRLAWPLTPTCGSTVTREKRCKGLQLLHSRSAPRVQPTDWRRRPDTRVQRHPSRLDYCNARLSGAPAATFDKLQRAQNNLARVVCQSRGRTDAKPLIFARYTGFRWGSGSPIK